MVLQWILLDFLDYAVMVKMWLILSPCPIVTLPAPSLLVGGGGAGGGSRLSTLFTLTLPPMVCFPSLTLRLQLPRIFWIMRQLCSLGPLYRLSIQNSCFCQILKPWKRDFSWWVPQLFLKEAPAPSPQPSVPPHSPEIPLTRGRPLS